MISEKEVIEEYNKGKSINTIAKEFSTYPMNIRRILIRHGIELRHDTKGKGNLYVKEGDKLIEWAKAQGRLVTKAELAEVIGRKKLSPSYFIKYPELGKYVKPYIQQDLDEYSIRLYNWLKENHIQYKPNDRKTLGVAVDALLLGEYSGIALQIAIKPPFVSKKLHEERMKTKQERALKKGLKLLFLDKEHFDEYFYDLSSLKLFLDDIKEMRK